MRLAEDYRYLDRDGKSIDPPMTDYERELLADLRTTVFGHPYLVYKIPQRPNESKLMWNPDFWVEKIVAKQRKVTMVIKALPPDTTLENFDVRMRDAYAIMVLNWEAGRHGGVLATPNRALIAPDEVIAGLGQQGYLPYNYAFEPF